MSGTSLDGLDIAFCIFKKQGAKWTYSIKKADTIKYSEKLKQELKTVENKSALELALLDKKFGHFIGEQTRLFIPKNKVQVDFISSHGHTIFHQPKKKLTLQIGSGAAIAAETKLPVVCDFRAVDVALGGQGAPLVPIGDKLLFSDFDACINLGGFANISFEINSKRIAFDICPVNIALNELVQKKGFDFDRNGALAKKGKIDLELLKKLNSLAFYNQKAPKSLGKEWVIENIYPTLNKTKISIEDKLRTFTEHAAIQISNTLHKNLNGKNKKILITGGGAYNIFLIESIKAKASHQIIVPDKNTIEYKEALIFAFLGLLRYKNEINTLKSVTGAEKDSIGGCIYL